LLPLRCLDVPEERGDLARGCAQCAVCRQQGIGAPIIHAVWHQLLRDPPFQPD
jgi:hypothetical protein